MRIQRVVMPVTGAESWTVTGDDGAVVDPAERYLAYLSALERSPNTVRAYAASLRLWFEFLGQADVGWAAAGAVRREGLPGLAHDAVIYAEELPFHHDQVARFIPEFVMAQLESAAALDRLPFTTTRNLVVVLIETGLRGGDACGLAFSPTLDDSAGWPCLRFEAAKVRAEQLIPLSARAAAAIRSQQEHVLRHWPAGSPWLFPGITGNDDGAKPYSHRTFAQQLARWQHVIDLRDQAGQPVTVTGHQFRHTLGTRLINSGVPQHVVQKLPGHASPHMTAHYARVHDTTIRAAFDHYQRQRVNIAGETLGYDPDAPTAAAEWVKHNLSRIRDSLPNGYCGRPPQQDCPHPNACLTCPDFQTTPEFLGTHRRQSAVNLTLITRAEANGQARLAAGLRQVQDSLDRIIPALEAIPDVQEPADDQG